MIHRFKLEVSTSDPQLQEDIGSLAELYHAVDFEQSVWQELVIHPELLGLDSLREQGSRCSEPLLNDLLSVHPLAAYVLTAPRHADLVSRSSLRILNSDTNDHMPEASKWITDLRIAATEARVWMTVAGHEPSYVRIPRLKFDILKILLKHGPAGLLQPELVQISGQDKRSLPRRTTELAQLGYLIKRPANKHGLKTSRLLHKRYSPEAAPITHQSTSDQDPKSFKDIDWAVVDREFLIDQVLKLLKSRRIIQRDDLKAEMVGYRCACIIAMLLILCIGCCKRSVEEEAAVADHLPSHEFWMSSGRQCPSCERRRQDLPLRQIST